MNYVSSYFSILIKTGRRYVSNRGDVRGSARIASAPTEVLVDSRCGTTLFKVPTDVKKYLSHERLT